MKRGDLELLGIIIAFIGIVLFFNSVIGGIAGFVILEDVGGDLGSISGVIFIVSGLVMAMFGKDKAKELEAKSGREKWAGMT